MSQSISHVSLVVRDYDEAIQFFTTVLRFRVIEDTRLSDVKRWVVVGPANGRGVKLLLAKAANPEQQSHVGNQTGGRVFMFLDTDDFWGDYHHMESCGVRFAESPREEAYGTVVVFYDLYGNKWDMVERKPRER